MVNNMNYNGMRTAIPQPVYPSNYGMSPFQQIFVQGIEGARAYQLPYGVNAAVLWDSEKDLFYVKQIDAMGRPYIAKTCAYKDYEEPKPEPAKQEASMPDMSDYMTIEQFEQMLRKLVVGEKGRIVIDESYE